MKNSLGNKLVSLRKQEKMTQEQVADELKITRQTVSNWELNQTKPDLDQIKGLSKLYKISIDELIDNDTKELLTEKISNVEKLTGLVYKILKLLLILMGIFIILFILYKVFYSSSYAWFIGMDHKHECLLNTQPYYIEIETEQEQYKDYNNDIVLKDGKVINVIVSPYISIPELEKQERIYQVKNLVYSYFEKNGGSCSEYYDYTD